MTDDGGTTSYVDWDAARIALGEVARVFVAAKEGETVAAEDFQGVHNYLLIPAGVRATLESLSLEEQTAIKKVIGNLASNHFYLEGGPGGLAFY